MRGVEYVEHFPPEFDPQFFSNPEVALERHIQIAEARSGDYVAAGIPERKRRGLHKRRRVEQALRIALSARQVRIADEVGSLCRSRADVRAIDTVHDRER